MAGRDQIAFRGLRPHSGEARPDPPPSAQPRTGPRAPLEPQPSLGDSFQGPSESGPAREASAGRCAPASPQASADEAALGSIRRAAPKGARGRIHARWRESRTLGPRDLAGVAHPCAMREERFRAVAVFLGPRALGRPLLGLPQPPLGVGELLFQRPGVEVLGRRPPPRPAAGRGCRRPEPAVGLGVAPGLGVGELEPQLGRPQRRQQRRVVGEDADLADLGAGRDLARFAAKTSPSGVRTSTSIMCSAAIARSLPGRAYAAAAALAFSVTWSIEPCM